MYNFYKAKTIAILTLSLFAASRAKCQWVRVSNALCYSHPFAEADSNLLAMTETDGLLLSNDSGYSWSQYSGTPSGNQYFFGLKAINTTFFAWSDSSIFKSTDKGNSWNQSESSPKTFYYDFAIYGGNGIPIILFSATDDGVFISSDTGKSWIVRNNGLTDTNIRAFAVNGSNIFAGTLNGVFLSTDEGRNWTKRSNGLTSNGILAMASIDSDLLAGTFQGGIFLSSDSGNSWGLSSNGLTLPMNVNSFARTSKAIFASSTPTYLNHNNIGIYLSDNNGLSWSNVSDGLDSIIYSLSSFDGYLFASTGSGIYRCPLSDFNISDYVIPSVGTTRPSDTLKIYDLLGSSIYAGPAPSKPVLSSGLYIERTGSEIRKVWVP